MVEETIARIAEKLRRERESSGLTLQQLSDLSDVAPSTIQKIEAGTMMPSVAVMMKVARGLRKKIGFFLDAEEPATEVSLTRKRDRSPGGLRSDEFVAEALSNGISGAEFDGFHITLPPGGSSGAEPVRHRGEDLVYCIRGRVTFTVGQQQYTLGAGDCLHFKGKLPHSWKNSGRMRAEIVIVSSLPTPIDKSALHRFQHGERRSA